MSKDLTEALDALMRQQRQQRPKPPTPRGSAAPQISSGVPGSSEASSGSGDGVASPLIEHDAAAREYAGAALEAGCAFVNCIPSFIASDAAWAARVPRRLPAFSRAARRYVARVPDPSFRTTLNKRGTA